MRGVLREVHCGNSAPRTAPIKNKNARAGIIRSNAGVFRRQVAMNQGPRHPTTPRLYFVPTNFEGSALRKNCFKRWPIVAIQSGISETSFNRLVCGSQFAEVVARPAIRQA
jgi:hypothetical protein